MCWEKDPRVKILVQKNNPGIGWAYREGMEAATGNYVALMAADLETEPAAVDRMVDKILQTGCDGVIANRWLPGGGFTNYDSIKLGSQLDFSKDVHAAFLDEHRRPHIWIQDPEQERSPIRSSGGERSHEICIETTVENPSGKVFGNQAGCPPSGVGCRKRGTQCQHVPQEFSICKISIPNPCRRQVMVQAELTEVLVSKNMSHCSDDDPSSRDPE